MDYFLFGLVIAGILKSCNGNGTAGNRTLPYNKQLHEDLFSRYGTTSVRPVRDNSLPVEVRFFYKPFILSEFDEQNQRLSVVGSLYMGWTDEFLVWDPADYGGVHRFSVRAKDIWFPDITAYERLDPGTAMANVFEPYAIVHDNGHIDYYDRTELTVYCRLEMTLFPFDTQRCKVAFTSYSYDSNQFALEYANSTAAMENVFDPNGVWRLDHIEVEQIEKMYLCCASPFVEVHYTLIMQRIGNFYVYSIWIPSCLLSSMILAVFVMHPNSGEKVSLSVSNVLAFVLFQQIVVGSMPRSGDDSPVIVAFFSAMIAISCLSVLASAVVLRVYHHDPRKPVPRIFRWICLRHKHDRERESASVLTRNANQVGHDENGHSDPGSPTKGYDNNLRNDIVDDQSLRYNGPTEMIISDSEMIRTSRQNREETDWMILALMMDKVFLAIAVFALLGTLAYCGISYIVLVQ